MRCYKSKTVIVSLIQVSCLTHPDAFVTMELLLNAELGEQRFKQENKGTTALENSLQRLREAF